MPRVQKTQKLKSVRAGLILPVGRFISLLKKDRRRAAVGEETMVYFTGVVEFIMSEIIKGTLACREKSNNIIQSNHISRAISRDFEINKWLGNVVIPNSSPSSHIPAILLKKKNKSRKSKKENEQQQETNDTEN